MSCTSPIHKHSCPAMHATCETTSSYAHMLVSTSHTHTYTYKVLPCAKQGTETCSALPSLPLFFLFSVSLWLCPYPSLSPPLSLSLSLSLFLFFSLSLSLFLSLSLSLYFPLSLTLRQHVGVFNSSRERTWVNDVAEGAEIF